jgi:hypothetical protein
LDVPIERKLFGRHGLSEGDDVRFESFGESTRGARGRRKPRNAFADPLAEVCGVNRNNFPVAHLESAGNHHVRDGGRVGAGDELVDEVGIGNEIDMAEVNKHEVGAGILFEPAASLKSKNIRAAKRRQPDHLG